MKTVKRQVYLFSLAISLIALRGQAQLTKSFPAHLQRRLACASREKGLRC